jgi:hypothetical protein
MLDFLGPGINVRLITTWILLVDMYTYAPVGKQGGIILIVPFQNWPVNYAENG